MIQSIRDAHREVKFVCEIPEGWNAALLRDGCGNVSVVMVNPNSLPPVLLKRDDDGVWRQHEIKFDAPQAPQE